MGLHAAAPAAALFTGIAFGDGSPAMAFAPSRITLGLFDPPYLAPLPALGSGGSDTNAVGALARRPASPHTALSPHGGAVDHAPFGEERLGQYAGVGEGGD